MSLPMEDRLFDRAHPELLLYDYYKHMTTLILATLGGILSISQAGNPPVPIRDLYVALGCIGFGGVTALYAMDEMIAAGLASKPVRRWVRWARWFVGASFGLGVGAFIGVFLETTK